MDIDVCNKCKHFHRCEDAGYLNSMCGNENIGVICGEFESEEIKSVDKITSLNVPPFAINSNFSLIDYTYLHLKTIITNEGIYEDIRYDGNLESFIKDLNKGRIVKLTLLSENDKVIYLNSIYIISFEI